MIQFKRLDHILLPIPAGKREDARIFYSHILGLKEVPGDHPGGALWFAIGDLELHLREEAPGPYSKRHPAFEITNLDEARQHLQRHGIEITYSSDIDGRQRFFFHDPFGNRFELLEFTP
ncbi:VOC family protein [Larkinella bovis]|uniref:VOC family protein n=1 Tax=Larkinella bovis TaxID=683041 RepID=A0ABW0ICB7_9BACT